MATTLSKHWKNKIPIPLGHPTTIQPVLDCGTSAAAGGTVLLPSATNDVFKLTTLPERVTIGANCVLVLGDHDSGANLVVTLQLNNGTTTKPIIHQSSAGQAGGVARSTKIPTTETGVGFTTDSKLWWVEILISTGAAGGAQAAKLLVQLDLCGWYTPGAVTE